MDTLETRGTFEQTAEFQMRYDDLCSICEVTGSMVSQDRTIERDTDIAPHTFYRNGTREYLFPKQEVKLIHDLSEVIDDSKDYGIRTEEQTFSFDEWLVKGRIKIEYQDGDNSPTLKVTDVLGNSELPEKVQAMLGTIFSNRIRASVKR